MELNKNIIEEFEGIINYPLSKYFQTFVTFISNDYNIIVSFYSGDFTQSSSIAFNNLSFLKKETQKLFAVISLNKARLTNYKWWEVIDQIEEIDTKLTTISVLSKWMRSTITNTSYNPNPEIEIAFGQGKTLESISRNVLGEEDWNNKWVDIAIKNDLEEEEYTSEGGGTLKLNYANNARLFEINSIVDNPIGDRILGIDLFKKISFDVDNQDLLVLSPEDTFIQSTNIYINLRKNDNPEFPEDGLDPNVMVGSNINSIAYPIILRQSTDVFSKDDTMKNFLYTGIRRNQDALFFDFSVNTRLDETPQTISLKF